VLDESLRLFDHHLGHLHVTRCRFIEGGGDDLTLHGALHLGDFFGPLVDEQHDQIDLGMIRGDRRRDVLQQHGLAGLGRRDDEAALALADRRHEIDRTRGQIFGGAVATLELQSPRRMQRREVLEEHLAACVLRRVEIDFADLEQREVTLAIFGRTDQPRDGVAGAQIETPNLRRADVDVIRAGKVRTVGRAQEAEAVLQDLEHAVTVDVLALARMRLQQAEDDVLLARAGHVLDAERTRHLDQPSDRHRLERGEVHRVARSGELFFADDLGVFTGIDEGRVIHRHVVVHRATDVAVAHAAILVAITVPGSLPLSSRAALPAA